VLPAEGTLHLSQLALSLLSTLCLCTVIFFVYSEFYY